MPLGVSILALSAPSPSPNPFFTLFTLLQAQEADLYKRLMGSFVHWALWCPLGSRQWKYQQDTEGRRIVRSGSTGSDPFLSHHRRLFSPLFKTSAGVSPRTTALPLGSANRSSSWPLRPKRASGSPLLPALGPPPSCLSFP